MTGKKPTPKGRRFRCSRAAPVLMGVPLYGVEVVTPDGRRVKASSREGARLISERLRGGHSVDAVLTTGGAVVGFELSPSSLPPPDVAAELLRRFDSALRSRAAHLGLGPDGVGGLDLPGEWVVRAGWASSPSPGEWSESEAERVRREVPALCAAACFRSTGVSDDCLRGSGDDNSPSSKTSERGNMTRLRRLDIDRSAMRAKLSSPLWPKGPREADLRRFPLVGAAEAAVVDRMNFLISGPSGIGKTEFFKFFLRHVTVGDVPVDVVYFSAVLTTVENMKVAFPVEGDDGGRLLRTLLDARLVDDRPKVIVIDEAGQADRELHSAMMELLSEGSIGGRKVPGLLSVVLLDNPRSSGYGRLQSLEFAQADRMAWVDVTAADTPWRYAVARRWKLEDPRVLDTYLAWAARMDDLPREVVNPRVLDQGILYCASKGFPLRWALPVMDGERVKVVAKGDDVTEAFLRDIAGALDVPSDSPVADPVEAAVRAVVEDGVSAYIEGPPGVGKTSRVKEVLDRLGVATVYTSVANTLAEDLYIPFPSADGKGIEPLQYDFFASPEAKVLVADEFTRGADPRATNAFNELVQTRSLGGRPVPGLRGVVAINNPPVFRGEKLMVRPLTIPQATRFSVNIQVDGESTGALEWIVRNYDPEGEIVVTWWKEVLSPEEREGVSARTMERLIKLHRRGQPLRWALARPGGEPIRVPLGDLETKLATRGHGGLRTLTEIVRDVDAWAVRLKGRTPEGDPTDPEAHAVVYRAFLSATMEKLREHRDQVRSLIAFLLQEYQMRLLTVDNPQLSSFWYEVWSGAA